MFRHGHSQIPAFNDVDTTKQSKRLIIADR
jgi:hypothetical protein